MAVSLQYIALDAIEDNCPGSKGFLICYFKQLHQPVEVCVGRGILRYYLGRTTGVVSGTVAWKYPVWVCQVFCLFFVHFDESLHEISTPLSHSLDADVSRQMKDLHNICVTV